MLNSGEAPAIVGDATEVAQDPAEVAGEAMAEPDAAVSAAGDEGVEHVSPAVAARDGDPGGSPGGETIPAAPDDPGDGADDPQGDNTTEAPAPPA